MEPTIKCGRHFAQHAKLTGSRFEDVCLGDAEFDNVSLAGASLNNVNMSDMTIQYVQIGGTTFRHMGLPPSQRGTAKQRPLVFEDCDLNKSTFAQVDLSGVKLLDCKVEGMTIDGVLVTEMIAAYKNQKK